jgi:hypothetical protein
MQRPAMQPMPPQVASPSPPPLPPQPPALPPGTLLAGRYLIQGYIAGGGFGHIYVAQDRVLGHRRAVKEAFYRDTHTQSQFRLEAEFILNARHPNLVRGYAVFEQAGRFYLVMDYVDGYTTEEIAIQHIRSTGRTVAEAQALDWVLPICDAAYALHAQPMPIIHRDVKPANIKVTRQGIPVLIDLGLAKLYSRGTQTLGAALAFTPGYAPPEQYQASGSTDQRTDVYGMGATLYYLLTGYQPTEAPARLSAKALPPPRSLNPAISPRSEAIVLRAMSLNPAERHQTMRELLGELQQARASLPTSAPTISAGLTDPQHVPAPIMRACARCGTGNPPMARFCMRCGAPVIEAREMAAPHGTPVADGLHLIANDGRTAAVQPTPAVAIAVLEAPAESGKGQVIPAAIAPAPALADGARQALPPAPVAQPAPPQPAAIASPVMPPQPQRKTRPMPPRQTAVAQPAAVAPHGAAFMANLKGAEMFGLRLAVQDEALVLICALLSWVCLALSLFAYFAGMFVTLNIPGIALASLSLVRQTPDTPREFKYLAGWGLGLNCAVVAGWLLAQAFLHR